MYMLTMEEILNNRLISLETKKRSERADVLSQIHPLYIESTRKENWKRYIKWLKENKYKSDSYRIHSFKKTKNFLKTRNERAFAVMLSHIPTPDLYYILSIGKDKANRNENFSGWLMGEIKFRAIS